MPKQNQSQRAPRKPVKKSKAVIDAILELMMQGYSLRSICRRANMPHFITVLKWVRDDPDFYRQYCKAQEVCAEVLAGDVIDLSRQATGKENADAIRVQIDAVKWMAGKMRPKRFGDKIDITSDGEKVQGITYQIIEKREKGSD